MVEFGSIISYEFFSFCCTCHTIKSFHSTAQSNFQFLSHFIVFFSQSCLLSPSGLSCSFSLAISNQILVAQVSPVSSFHSISITHSYSIQQSFSDRLAHHQLHIDLATSKFLNPDLDSPVANQQQQQMKTNWLSPISISLITHPPIIQMTKSNH